MIFMILVFSSVTTALQAQKKLSSAGISSALVRTPRVRELRGCGYGLCVSDRTTARRAAAVCSENGIKPLAVIEDDRKAAK